MYLFRLNQHILKNRKFWKINIINVSDVWAFSRSSNLVFSKITQIFTDRWLIEGDIAPNKLAISALKQKIS